MGTSNELSSIISVSIATGNFVIDNVTPQTGVPKLLEYLSKISSIEDLTSETREYSKGILERVKKREDDRRRLEEERKKQEQQKSE